MAAHARLLSGYVEEATSLSRSRGAISVQLFGSRAGGGGDSSSDVDLLVVMPDETAPAAIHALLRDLVAMSERHLGIASHPENRLEALLDRWTGANRSAFVCREKDVLDGSFRRTFNTAPFFWRFAPWRTVLWNVFHHRIILWGKDVAPQWGRIQPPHARRARELARSLVLNLFLTIPQPLYRAFSRRATHYALTGVKWSAHAVHTLRKGHPAERTQDALASFPIGDARRAKFARVRASRAGEWSFLAAAPWWVLRGHVVAAFQPREETGDALTPATASTEKEYGEACHSLRQAAVLRFALLTTFLALTGGLLALAARAETYSLVPRRWFFASAMVVTAAFLLIDASNVYIWERLRSRAAALERQLGYDTYRRLAPGIVYVARRPATVALWIIYAVMLTLWSSLALRG